MVDLQTFDPADFIHIASVVEIWNTSCPAELAITPKAVGFNTAAVTGSVQAGRLAVVDGRPAGFALVRAMPGAPEAQRPDLGNIELIAVKPEHRRRGIGHALLAWAESWLAVQGCRRFRLGAGLRPFAPGLPGRLASEGFFRAAAFDNSGKLEWDMAHDLADYRSPEMRMAPVCEVRPARPGEEDALLAFFRREYPGRWQFEYEEALRNGSRISDYTVLVTAGGIDGFAHMTLEDSYWPLDRVFPWRLPRPWAQLGPLGVSAGLRGQGYGGSLVDGALRNLAGLGIRGCVIDWTDLVDFYRKFGFEPYNKYVMLQKVAAS
ncbi:MAG TPA: GNAT family N-acetyltransferase [Anaerolineae bacterium]